MKKLCLFLSFLLVAGGLAGCDGLNTKGEPPHEHSFDLEHYEHNETSHWHKATCEHTDLVKGLADHNYGGDNVCDTCGYTKPAPVVVHEHTYASEWSKDETNHWHASNCEHTGLAKDIEAHNFGGDNICDNCGYVKETPIPVHNHTFDVEHWEKTSTHHWHKATCEHTGLASDIGEHTFNDNGECTVCGYKKEVEHYSFLLRSDYCELDNENIYEEGEEVELSLTIKDEFKASSTLPENIEVYSKGVLLTKGTDYTYAIEGETGKLSLTVKGDIVVIAFKDKNQDSFKITEAQFADAMNISDESHLQYNLTAGFYSSFSIIMQQYDVEYSPNVTYRGSYSFDASRNGGSISCDYTYIEKENEAYTKYHSDKSGIWTTSPTDEATFNGSKSLSLGWFPFISGFQLTYDRIKDNFNSITNAYEVYFTYQEYDVKFEVTFHNRKLINVSYEGIFEADRGIFGNVDVSYIEKEVSISEAAKPHVHTFDTEWTTNITHHWHEATCIHTGEKSEYGPHTFDASGVCSTCGYATENLYPIITKFTQGETVIENTWADDLSNVLSNYDDSEYIYFELNEDGYIVFDGKMIDNSPVPDSTFVYEGEMLVSKTSYTKGVASTKETYTYTNDKKPLCTKYFEIKEGVETLWKQEDYEYLDGCWTEKTLVYNESAQDLVFDCLDKWTITTEGENTKHTLERQHEEEGSFKFLGHLIYNNLGQIIEKKDLCYSSLGDYFKYDYITYTEDGALSTVLEKFDGSNGTKNVYSYDSNGYIIDMKTYDYNDTSSDYDILSGGYEYTVDSRGTVIKMSSYEMQEGQKVKGFETEMEIKYISVNLQIDYLYYLGETKGSYNQFELELLPILG